MTMNPRWSPVFLALILTPVTPGDTNSQMAAGPPREDSASLAEDAMPMQLLFVPGEITSRDHCFDRIEPLVRHADNPVLVGDRPWEGNGVNWPAFLYSESDGLFKLWYTCTAKGDFGPHEPVRPLIDNAEISGVSFVCYATSEDGIRWDKPSLGKVKIQGSADNNIVLADSGFFLGCASVIEDLDDPDPARRYKMLLYDNDGAGHDGIRTAVSPDGIDWTFVGEFPLLPSQDTPCLWHDRRRGTFVAFLKERLDGRRARCISTSTDFTHWSAPSVLLAPGPGDSPTLHFYGNNAFHHHGHDFAFLNRFEQSTQKLDIELAALDRGTAIRRLPSRPCVLAPGNDGEWDSGIVLPGLSEPIVRGGTCYFYYGGSTCRHDESADYRADIGLATFSAGRLVGQQFEGEGWFSGMPFRCPGGALTLDAVARNPVRVEVHTAGYGGPIPGFTKDECGPVTGDSREHAIRWKTRDSLDELRGRFIILRVYGKDSVVYGATLG